MFLRNFEKRNKITYITHSYTVMTLLLYDIQICVPTYNIIQVILGHAFYTDFVYEYILNFEIAYHNFLLYINSFYFLQCILIMVISTAESYSCRYCLKYAVLADNL
jgi:hypothetical protein